MVNSKTYIFNYFSKANGPLFTMVPRHSWKSWSAAKATQTIKHVRSLYLRLSQYEYGKVPKSTQQAVIVGWPALLYVLVEDFACDWRSYSSLLFTATHLLIAPCFPKTWQTLHLAPSRLAVEAPRYFKRRDSSAHPLFPPVGPRSSDRNGTGLVICPITPFQPFCVRANWRILGSAPDIEYPDLSLAADFVHN